MMSSDLPIACSLSAAEMPRRLAEISRVGRDGLLAARMNGNRAVLRFRPRVRADLDAIVAAERECCAFLSMEVTGEADAVRLTIEAPAGAKPVLEDLVAAFGAAT